MATDATDVAPPLAARRIVRLSGTELTPRWRGRVHLVALAAVIPAAVELVLRRPSLDVETYAVGLIALFGVSSAYHLLPLTARCRRIMRKVDHVMIYLFIGASYTPFCWLALPRSLGIPVLALVWFGAAVGVVIKLAGFERARRSGSALYLVIGSLAIVTVPHTLQTFDPSQLGLLAATGGSYLAGAIVLFGRRPDPFPDRFGYHEVWHSAVVLAAAFYFVLVWSLTR
jgi:hemolysin III